jgi:hypothetical protein
MPYGGVPICVFCETIVVVPLNVAPPGGLDRTDIAPPAFVD